ncbi:MAG: hypothetical protein QW779_04110 [Nitrososphaerales archaeon]
MIEQREILVRDLGRILAKIGALQFGAFTLPNGELSPYYIDFKVVPSFPSAFQKVIDAYIGLIKNSIGLSNLDALCGISITSLPYASTIAYCVKKPLIYIKGVDEVKKSIEGFITPGWKVVILENFIRTGTSFIRAAEIVRSESGIVENAIVLVDGLEGGKNRLDKAGIKLHSLTNIKEIAFLLHDMNVINDKQLKVIYKRIKW